MSFVFRPNLHFVCAPVSLGLSDFRFLITVICHLSCQDCQFVRTYLYEDYFSSLRRHYPDQVRGFDLSPNYRAPLNLRFASRVQR